MLKQVVISIVLSIGCLSFINAQTDSARTDSDSEWDDAVSEFSEDFSFQSDFKVTFYGDHFFQYHYPLDADNRNFNTLITAPKMFNRLGVEITDNNIELVSEWEFRGFPDKTGNWEAISNIRMQDNYIAWDHDNFNLGFGFQKYAWGVADGTNPTDNLNPENYEMGYEIEDIPVLSVSADYYPKRWWAVKGVYIPFEQSDKYFFDFRDEIPRSLFQKFYISGFNFNTLKPEISPRLAEKQVNFRQLKFSPESGIFGIKNNFYFSGIDISFSYIYDIDPFYTPDFDLEEYTVEVPDDVIASLNETLPGAEAERVTDKLRGNTAYRIETMDLKRRRVHRLGFDMKTIVDKYGIWLEACYSITEDHNNTSYRVRNHDVEWVTGFDFSYGPHDKYYLNLQYTGKWIPDYYNTFYTDYTNGMPDFNRLADKQYMREYFYRATVQPLGMQTERFRHGVMTQLEWSLFDGKITPALDGYYTFPVDYDTEEKKRYGNLLLMPEIDYAPGNALHVFFGANLAYSWYKPKGNDTIKDNDRSNFTGYLNPYNNIYFRISYQWEYKNEQGK